MPDAAWVGDPPIRLTKYIRQSPEPPQHAFLFLNDLRDIFYGGAAGGGKSSALLAAALQYVDVPGYSALLIRRTFPDLNQPGALIPRSKEWLSGTDATWNDNDHRWTFPSGATLTFGHLKHEDDKLKYQGAEFQFIGFDELTQFTRSQFTYMFSRCRRPKLQDDASDEDRARVERLADVPLRVRGAGNPGGPGHEWVKDRYGLYRPEGEPKSAPYVCHRPDWPHRGKRAFIPAKLQDNPHLDRVAYEAGLDELDHITRKQLRDGDWDTRPDGDLFKAEWFKIVDSAPDGCRWLRFWDLAATEVSEASPNPDWTAGVRVGLHPTGNLYVEDVKRLREQPAKVEDAAKDRASRDGISTLVRLEQEPGSSGKAVVDHWIRTVLPGYAVDGIRSTGSKADRARIVSAKAEHGLVHLVRGSWNRAFIDEHVGFMEDDSHDHDDMVDGMSGAVIALMQGDKARQTSYRPGQTKPVVKRGDLTLRGDKYVDKKR